MKMTINYKHNPQEKRTTDCCRRPKEKQGEKGDMASHFNYNIYGILPLD